MIVFYQEPTMTLNARLWISFSADPNVVFQDETLEIL